MSRKLVTESLTIDFTVYYAKLPPSPPRETPPALLLGLHGFGQKCTRFLRDFEPLRKRNILCVAPQGPHQFYVDVQAGKVGCNWLTRYEKEDSIRVFLNYMERLMRRIHEDHPFDPRKVFYLGFSQGVSMAYRLAVRGARRPAGLIACCADLAPDVAERLGEVEKFPVFLAQGEDDPLFPPEKAEEAARVLAANDFRFQKRLFEGGHEITAALVEDIGDWIEAESAKKQEGV